MGVMEIYVFLTFFRTDFRVWFYHALICCAPLEIV
jgi:hypothetical protein